MPEQNLDSYLSENRQRFTDELIELLMLPSVSTDPERKPDMQRTAELVRDHLQRLGFSSDIRPTALHPVVYAELITDPSLPP